MTTLLRRSVRRGRGPLSSGEDCSQIDFLMLLFGTLAGVIALQGQTTQNRVAVAEVSQPREVAFEDYAAFPNVTLRVGTPAIEFNGNPTDLASLLNDLHGVGQPVVLRIEPATPFGDLMKVRRTLEDAGHSILMEYLAPRS